MKNLFRKLRRRNQGDNERGARIDTRNNEHDDHISSIGREGISDIATQSKGLIGNSSSFAATSQHEPSNLPTSENALLATDTPQPNISPGPPTVDKSAAYSKDTNELEGTIQVKLASNCSTCFSLDARKAPPDREHNWARREYNFAVGIPSRKLSIKHTQLLASSASGCIYCILVCTSLSAIRPGWENKNSFIELFLALGFPVVVRWINGSTFTMNPVRDESLGGYIRHSMELRLAETPGIIEPDVELEIFRPEAPQEMIISSPFYFCPLVCIHSANMCLQIQPWATW